jgi:hypothetical protein
LSFGRGSCHGFLLTLPRQYKLKETTAKDAPLLTGLWMSNRNCRPPDVSFVPKSRMATLGFRPNEKTPTDRRLVGSGGFLEGENLLPGFSYPIADLFKEWDWE